MTTQSVQFGWVMPPGIRSVDKLYIHEGGVARPGYLGIGPQSRPPRERWDAGIRRALNVITGHWDSAWMTDHLQWGDDDCLEAMTALAFYAALTPALRWGTMVACQSYRNPAYMAKIGSTLQYLTHNQFIMGIGAGWKDDEYVAYGYPFPSPGVRVEQLDETVQIFKSMWAEVKTNFTGTHYAVKDAINLPQTAAPTLMIGGSGEKKMLPLIAKYADWWNSNSSVDEFARKVEILKRECAAVGRDFSSLRLTWFGGVAAGRTDAEVQARARDDFTRSSGIMGTPDQIKARLKAYVDLGCTYFMFDTRGVPEPGELELLIEISREFM